VDLTGEWIVTEISGEPTVGERPPTIGFDPAESRVAGHGSINRFFGGYEFEGDQITFAALGSTLMAGPQELMDQEHRFLRTLQGTMTVALDGDDVVLSGPEGSVRLSRPAGGAEGDGGLGVDREGELLE
jgi:heat shock protein HslJ